MHTLMENAEDVAPGSDWLSSEFPRLMEKAMEVAERPSSGLSGVRAIAYEAVAKMLESAPPEHEAMLRAQVVPELMARLAALHGAGPGRPGGRRGGRDAQHQAVLLACLHMFARFNCEDGATELLGRMVQLVLEALRDPTSALRAL